MTLQEKLRFVFLRLNSGFMGGWQVVLEFIEHDFVFQKRDALGGEGRLNRGVFSIVESGDYFFRGRIMAASSAQTTIQAIPAAIPPAIHTPKQVPKRVLKYSFITSVLICVLALMYR